MTLFRSVWFRWPSFLQRPAKAACPHSIAEGKGAGHFNAVRSGTSQRHRRHNGDNGWRRGCQAAIGSLVPVMLAALPGAAAEEVYLSFGPLQRSIPITAIEAFAQDGTITRELRPYVRSFTPEQLSQIQGLLTTRVGLEPVAVSQFLYTDQGEILLERFGNVVRTQSFRSGALGIRAAMVFAAAEPDGLTPLNILRQFPLRTVRIDLAQASRLAAQLEQLVSQTQDEVTAIARQSLLSSALDIQTDFDQLPNLQQRGSYLWQKRTLILRDNSRRRTYPADIYLPLDADGIPLDRPAPTIVISHGFGSNRETFAYLATHLASHGFVVAVPEHPGSNTEQLEALASGRASVVIDPEEFINRPLDVSYLLDELERRAQFDTGFQGRVDVSRVGVFGQSLGAYTAIALAGAPIRSEYLATNCDDLQATFNLSLLVQCRLLEVALPPEVQFYDERVKAIFTVNPLVSGLMDDESLRQIAIPVAIAASSADTITPALLEQIQPFTQLTADSRYLIVLENGTHFSSIDVPPGDAVAVELPLEVVGPDPAIAHRYLQALNLAFFRTYLTDDEEYRPFLSSAYSQFLSEPLLPLYLVQDWRASLPE